MMRDSAGGLIRNKGRRKNTSERRQTKDWMNEVFLGQTRGTEDTRSPPCSFVCELYCAHPPPRDCCAAVGDSARALERGST